MAPTEGALVLLGIVGLVCLAILVWTGRRRFPLRIGTGNFFRRKTQVAIVVAGLLIGTAIIASSYVIQSTFDYTIRAAVFRNLDHVDELVYVAASDGTRQPFDLSVFQSLDANRSRMPHVDGLAPRYQVGVSVVDATSGLFEPSASGMGFDASHELGTFIRLDGSSWDGAGLGGSEAVLNEKLAKAVEAKIGDGLIVYIGAAGAGAPLTVTVKEIVLDEGRGAWNDAANLFVRLDVLQTGLGQPGRINTIAVSNLGGVAEGYLISEDAVREVAGELPTAPSFTVAKVKADAIEQSTQGVIQISQLFTLLGSFTIIAGILLIVNIFVMLAEERKGEMGVARALGMRRSNLVQSFVAEGMFYAVLSAAVGSLAGLLVAGLILWGFEQAFPAQLLGGVRFVLTWTPADLIQAFAIGFLITMATIGIASFRISKLNIVRAIRDIPEPVPQESTRRELAVGIALVGTGVLATLYAFATESALLQDVGPVALAIGLAVLVMRRLSPRVAFSPAGVFIIAWLLLPNRPVAPSADEIALFILAGLFLVLGGLLIVLFNSDTLLAVATRVVRRRTWRPVIRTAIAYPMNKKFRTGATLASIALVMFTIATMSGIQAMVSSSIEATTAQQSAGFDLIGQSNPAIPKPDWRGELAASAVAQDLTEARELSLGRVRLFRDPGLTDAAQNTSFLGVAPDWPNIPFEFQALDANYSSREAAWAAVQSDPSLAILDGTASAAGGFGPGFGGFQARIGDALYFRNMTGGLAHVRVIGILYAQFVQGVFVSWDAVRTHFGVDYPSVFYFKVAAGKDPTEVGHDLERTFVRYQLLTFDIHAFIGQLLEIIVSVFNLLTAYLALGLIVGIAGLGVITMRNVVERRTETGALRAIGYRKSMVLKSFLFELSFIALTGIAMGVVLGVALSYVLYLNFFEGQGVFVVPWVRLATLSAIAFGGAVLATASPAIRAARMPPAEALRTYE